MSEHLQDHVLSALIDGELSLAGREAALGHLRQCASCAERQEAMVAVVATLRQLEPARWSEDETEAIVDALSRRAPGRRVAAAAGALIGVIVCWLYLLPLIALPLAALALSLRIVAGIFPPPVPLAASSMLLGVLIVAVFAPLLAYPLARWR